VSPADGRHHYSYTLYADPATAQSFDARRFGGPIGELVAEGQAHVLTAFLAPCRHGRILDVGTGTGRAALLLASGGAEVTGVDASEEMLAVARQRSASAAVAATFAVGDAHQLDFPDKSFDAAVCLRVLMHTPGWRQVIGELCRVADTLVVLDYPSASSAAAVQALGRRVKDLLGGRTEPYRVFSDGVIASVFSAV
jgi:2-polyprenyl-3-methyl-5-hydroxy-6-metoxy-1,4-benzoquinol methylase